MSSSDAIRRSNKHPPLGCPHCDATFRRLDRADEHVESEHKEESQQ